jgi:hypothetical protein
MSRNTERASKPIEVERREPSGIAMPPERHRRKWEKIVSAFLAGDWETLHAAQRTGARGRIFATLIQHCLEVLGIGYVREPVFAPVPASTWYIEFAARHGLKLRMDHNYNPDFLLEDGTWVEATLSENTAFKKLFRHGHQAPRLLVVWLDRDDGGHKRLCEEVEFPNASTRPVDWYYPQLEQTAKGRDVVEKLELLRNMKGEIP